MASTQLNVFTSMLLLSLAFALASANEQVPAKPVEKHVDVGIEGVVYCQSCEHYGTWSLSGAKPISNSTIGVICKDYKKRVSFYKAFQTDANGYFYAELKGFKMGHSLLDHPLHSCSVKLVSSPQENCNSLTNVNYGLNGAPLRYEDKRLIGSRYEAVVYAAGPLAFRPAHCIPKNPA
ncbi:non-classical arabinogalactan protein 30-like [Coffea arabica]|uniref:Non-classical arabinogalactan protein 30-like n=1 Tax=Coffea arabica TaxID=13443 RepID=A0A6P6W9K8_COFAR|nr:non-classical arabinogalactan protein 30-like [Coffea arabica]XP_027110757.1 non-classical arabinogalactan protein 30-like [Coffea arabica]